MNTSDCELWNELTPFFMVFIFTWKTDKLINYVSKTWASDIHFFQTKQSEPLPFKKNN